jgi:hypothetical protein
MGNNQLILKSHVTPHNNIPMTMEEKSGSTLVYFIIMIAVFGLAQL